MSPHVVQLSYCNVMGSYKLFFILYIYKYPRTFFPTSRIKGILVIFICLQFQLNVFPLFLSWIFFRWLATLHGLVNMECLTRGSQTWPNRHDPWPWKIIGFLSQRGGSLPCGTYLLKIWAAQWRISCIKYFKILRQ